MGPEAVGERRVEAEVCVGGRHHLGADAAEARGTHVLVLS
jgi:hypothetical protein